MAPFLQGYQINGFEFDKKQLFGQRTWVLRIGNEKSDYYKDAAAQLDGKVRAPSFNNNEVIQQLRSKLKKVGDYCEDFQGHLKHPINPTCSDSQPPKIAPGGMRWL